MENWKNIYYKNKEGIKISPGHFDKNETFSRRSSDEKNEKGRIEKNYDMIDGWENYDMIDGWENDDEKEKRRILEKMITEKMKKMK